MPAKSEAQRKFLYATKGSAWVHRHHFANKGKLPGHVKGSKVQKKQPPKKSPKPAKQAVASFPAVDGGKNHHSYEKGKCKGMHQNECKS